MHSEKKDQLYQKDHSGQFLLDRAHLYGDIQVGEYSRVLRKIDYSLIPMLLLTATLGAVDKVALGTAALYHLREDLGLQGEQYSWVGSILYFGSLVGLVPMSWLMSRFPLGKALAVCSFTWGSLSLLHCACSDFRGLLAVRFFMGFVESCIVPGMTLLVSRFYLKHQQCFRLSIVFVFASSVINGFLSWLIGNFGGPLPQWKYLYILIGSITVVWSSLMMVYLPSSPMDFRLLSDRQKYIVVRALVTQSDSEHVQGLYRSPSFTGMDTTDWRWDQVREMLLDKKSYIVLVFNVGINIPNGGLATFSALVIKNLGFSAAQASLMGIPTGVVASLAALGFSYLIGKPMFRNKRCLIIIGTLCIPLIGAVINYVLLRTGSRNVAAQLAGVYLLYFYFAPYVILISLSQANTAGNTKKAAVYSMNYLGYCVGAIVGPQTFRASQAPHYVGGFAAMFAALLGCIVVACAYWAICRWENAQKIRLQDDDATLNVLDLTDKQNVAFMYTT